jgi:hypothetical protein
MGITSVACVNKSNGNAIPAFFHFNIVMNKWGVGHTNNHICRYGSVVSSRYLPLGLVGRKMK